MFYIYVLTNKLNNKIYVGQSYNPESRLRSHKSSARNGSATKLHRAMVKYGFDAFYLSIIDSRETKQEINILEREYIAKYNSIANGYNICEGGEGVTSEIAKGLISQERLNKTSEMLKEKWKDPLYRNAKIKELKEMWTPEKIARQSIICASAWNEERKTKSRAASKLLWSNPEYAKKQSETKKKEWTDVEYRNKMCAMSKIHANPEFLRSIAKANWEDPDKAKRMSQGRKTGKVEVLCLETLERFNSTTEATRKTGIARRCIMLNIKGETFRAGQKHWIKYRQITRKEADSIIFELECARHEKLLAIWRKRKGE